MLVDNGSTIVLGGIYSFTKQENHSGVPFLKDLPLLGWLFRSLYNPKTEKKVLEDHTAAMRDLSNDLQTFFKIAKKILPEIEHTKTLTRLEKEMEEMKRKSWDLV